MADRALARKVLETEAAAILALVDRARRAIRPRGRSCCASAAAASSSPAWASRASSAGRSPRRSRAPARRRSSCIPAEAIHGDLGVIQARRCRRGAVVQRRDRRDPAAARDDPAPRREARSPSPARRRRRWRRPPTSRSTAASTEEACPMNLVPTASTTAALAIGDALAMTLLVEKGFRQEDFANLHPGGKLGKRLMRVEALMHAGKQCPIVQRRHADARRHLRDVEQGARHDVRRRRRRRSCSASSPTATCGGTWSARRTSSTLTAGDVMTRGPGVGAADDAGRRGAEHHGAAQDHVDRRRRRTAAARVAGVVHLHDLWRTEMF